MSLCEIYLLAHLVLYGTSAQFKPLVPREGYNKLEQ